MKTFLIAAAALAAGTIAGYLVCATLFRRAQRNARARHAGARVAEPEKKIGVMDKVLVLEVIILLAYTVADMVVFWHTGSEPYTLTGCVFGVCGLENGVIREDDAHGKHQSISAAGPDRPGG